MKSYLCYLLLLLPLCVWAQGPVEELCLKVEQLYPSELLDEELWREACRAATAADELIDALDDPLARVPFGEAERAEVEYYRIEGSTAGYIHLTGFAGGETLVTEFDQALARARHDDGLILDLRGAQGGRLETAYAVMGRLTNAPIEGVSLHRYRAEGDTSQRSSYVISPRGPWQFDLPLVMLIDEGTAWPAEALVLAARARSQIETLGRPTRGTRGAEPERVTLADGTVVEIPTAAVRTAAGALLNGQPLAPGVNVDDENLFDYHNYPDPVLRRGLDELFRMIGRLEWLQDEYRKQLLDSASAKPR